MPNIRSMKVDGDGVEIVASDGRIFTIATAAIRSLYLAQTGNAVARKAAAIVAFKNLVSDTVGATQIDPSAITFDFDSATGKVINVTISDPVEA